MMIKKPTDAALDALLKRKSTLPPGVTPKGYSRRELVKWRREQAQIAEIEKAQALAKANKQTADKSVGAKKETRRGSLWLHGIQVKEKMESAPKVEEPRKKHKTYSPPRRIGSGMPRCHR